MWLGEGTETDNRGTGPKEQSCVKTHGAVCARPLKAFQMQKIHVHMKISMSEDP